MKLLSILHKINNAVTKILFNAAFCFMVIIALVMVTQVVLRYIKMPLPWAEEFSAYCSMWLAYMSLPYLTLYGHHITMTLIPDALSDRPRALLRIFSGSLFVFLLVVWIPASLELMYDGFAISTRQLPFSKGVVYISIPLGYIMTVPILLEHYIRDLLIIINPKNHDAIAELVEEKSDVHFDTELEEEGAHL